MTEEEALWKEAMENLFSARWNIPKACEFLRMPNNSESWSQMKKDFRDFCQSHGPTYL